MERNQIMELVLSQFGEPHPHELEDVIQGVRKEATPPLLRSEIKSAVLGLLQRRDLELTDDFTLQRPQHTHTS